MEDNGSIVETRATLNKSDTSGYGKVEYPDWSNCTSWPCPPTLTTAKYAYNTAHMAVQVGSASAQFKDRASVTTMTHRYGMYDDATGQDVLKTKSFGFPVRYTDANGNSQFAYYGAWQGRHQLWTGGGTAPATDTVVTREDRGSGQTAETYRVSAPFVGTLTKRTLVNGDINDILNIPVETWVNQNFNLMWDGTNSVWVDCKNPDFSSGSPICGTGSSTFTDFGSLVIDPNNNRKFIGINRWDNLNNTNIDYMYVDNSDPTVAGFYIATRDPNNGSLTATATKFTPSNGDQLWVNIGGSIYIAYTGTGATGWWEKKLINFDQRTWTPEFDPAGDTEYTLPLDREYYINNQGANYVVKRTGAGAYAVKIELQTVANPVNAATFLTQGVTTTFKPQWNDLGNSVYRFVTTSTDPKFLKLVYQTVGTNDTAVLNEQGSPVQAGDVVTQGVWGLVAYENDVATTQQFNWEYPRQGETWGTITYLLNTDSTYKLLDDPIRLNPVTLTNNAGQSKTLSLQYDGWMHGLPDLFEELRKNQFVMTADISDKIINIPAGTTVIDTLGTAYRLKPLEVGEFLNVVIDPGTLDIAVADTVDLTTVPVFVEHSMGTMPSVSTVKYSEGNIL